MQESPAKIDSLLEPLLTETSDARVDELFSEVITNHAAPVIKGVIRFKLRLNSYNETQRAELDDMQQEVVLQLNRLHYLLTRQRGFALWQDASERSIAGFAVWREQGKQTTRKLPEWAENPSSN